MLITTSLAAAAVAASLAAAAPAASTLRPLVVTVIDTADVSPTLVPRVLDEAKGIWQGAGVTFLWRRVSLQAAARIDRPLAVDTSSLRIVIGNARGTSRSGGVPLGWIQFEDEAPANEIYVSYHNALDFLADATGIVGPVSTMTVLERETYLGRIMGRALAHELGHYLLASKAHTHTGLMQATHTASDFFDSQRRGFGVAASQRQLIAARLRQDGVVVSR